MDLPKTKAKIIDTRSGMFGKVGEIIQVTDFSVIIRFDSGVETEFSYSQIDFINLS